MGSRIRRVAVLVVVVVVIVAAAGAYWYLRIDPKPVHYRTEAAGYATVTETLGMSGNLVPADLTDLNFGVSGQVTAVKAQAGQSVTVGAVLATLSTTDLQNSLTEAQAELSSAQAKLTSDEDATNPNAQTIQEDQDQVTIEQVDVNEAQSNLQDATLTAPVAGIVLEANVDVGQNVSASGASSSSSSSGSSTTSGSSDSGSSSSGSSGYAFEIMQPGSFDVSGSISDAEIGEVAVGQSAEITPAGATQALLGAVTAIAPEATISSGVATFPVTVQITSPSSSLRPGASASVDIVINRAVHVLAVPTAAIHTDGDASTVEVMARGDSPETVTVTIGAQDPTETQILSGITAGERVVLATVTSQVPQSSGTGLLGGGRGGGGFGGRGGGGGFGGRG
ncbi:MAG TPA: HlyD family efflux transporter periplasmic adaptor subunit [Candidatus Dormibacteraeota bacterium]|jgi:multidrug efflux pump subunit AcrA (membrane-fusion protein)|nr:HlyD family efflux transporter periplasmic adaptor subunit [Candidatus Dormibacteraeota bacterium]